MVVVVVLGQGVEGGLVQHVGAEDGVEVRAVGGGVPVAVEDGDVVVGDDGVEKGKGFVGSGGFFCHDVMEVDAGNVDGSVMWGPWGNEVALGHEVSKTVGCGGGRRWLPLALGQALSVGEGVVVEANGEFSVLGLESVVVGGDVVVVALGFLDEQQ